MFCSACGTPLTAGLSYCNRCGMNLNKDRACDSEKPLAGVLVTAIVLVAIFGLGAVIGGSVALKVAAEFHDAAVVLFMCLSFLVVGTVEVMLVRQLSRVLDHGRQQKQLDQSTQPLFQPSLMAPSEARVPHLRSITEPVTSVTENTTRTLEHSFRQT